jgi:hypothetical protein
MTRHVREDGVPVLGVSNEFASVALDIDTRGNGPRIRVTDVQTHKEIFLDPLELSALTCCSHADLAQFMEALRVPAKSGREPRS